MLHTMYNNAVLTILEGFSLWNVFWFWQKCNLKGNTIQYGPHRIPLHKGHAHRSRIWSNDYRVISNWRRECDTPSVVVHVWWPTWKVTPSSFFIKFPQTQISQLGSLWGETTWAFSGFNTILQQTRNQLKIRIQYRRFAPGSIKVDASINLILW